MTPQVRGIRTICCRPYMISTLLNKKCTKFDAGGGGVLLSWRLLSRRLLSRRLLSQRLLSQRLLSRRLLSRKQASHVSGSIILNQGHRAKFEFEFQKMSNHVFQQISSSFDRKYNYDEPHVDI